MKWSAGSTVNLNWPFLLSKRNKIDLDGAIINLLSEIRRSSVLNTARAGGRVSNEGGVETERSRWKCSVVIFMKLFMKLFTTPSVRAYVNPSRALIPEKLTYDNGEFRKWPFFNMMLSSSVLLDS